MFEFCNYFLILPSYILDITDNWNATPSTCVSRYQVFLSVLKGFYPFVLGNLFRSIFVSEADNNMSKKYISNQVNYSLLTASTVKLKSTI